MFKVLTSIILILLLAAQTFKDGVIVLDYYANTSSFAKSCVNKDKPKLHCNGKCQMMKKLQEEERKSQQVPERRVENEISICVKSFFIIETLQPLKLVPEQKTFYRSKGHSANYNVEIFHPPKIC